MDGSLVYYPARTNTLKLLFYRILVGKLQCSSQNKEPWTDVTMRANKFNIGLIHIQKLKHFHATIIKYIKSTVKSEVKELLTKSRLLFSKKLFFFSVLWLDRTYH